MRVEPVRGEHGGVRLKAADAVTDSRGEFALRVPTVPMDWVVHVQANEYQPQRRTVHVDGEQRVDVSFVLKPAEAGTKKGEGK